MSKTWTCPPEICALFNTEAMAAELGRPAALAWAMSQPCLMGDKILMPDVGGVMVELEKTVPGIQ